MSLWKPIDKEVLCSENNFYYFLNPLKANRDHMENGHLFMFLFKLIELSPIFLVYLAEVIITELVTTHFKECV